MDQHVMKEETDTDVSSKKRRQLTITQRSQRILTEVQQQLRQTELTETTTRVQNEADLKL